jgi:cell division protein FtsX
MTRFEASVIMFMVMAIMLILLFGVISIISILNDIKQQHEDNKDSILHLIEEGPTKIDWDELTKQQQDEFRKWLQMANINKLNKEDKN